MKIRISKDVQQQLLYIAMEASMLFRNPTFNEADRGLHEQHAKEVL
jgi:hypothetical protein